MTRQQYEQLIALVGHENFTAGVYWCKGVQVWYFEPFKGETIRAYLFGHLVERITAVAA